MTNKELYDMFRESQYVDFMEFLENEIEFVKEETCGYCTVSCGNDWCVTKGEK